MVQIHELNYLVDKAQGISFDLSFVTYEEYCSFLDSEDLDFAINEAIGQRIKTQLGKEKEALKGFGKGVKTIVKGTFDDLKKDIGKVAKEVGASKAEITKAFKQKSVFSGLKAFGFSLKAMGKGVQAATGLIKNGIGNTFQEIEKSNIGQKVKSGTMKVDQVLDKHPILKKVGGVAVAGMLTYAWLNMTFIGDLDYDFDVSAIPNALAGDWSISDTIVGKDGMMTAGLLGLGMATGLSVPWLGKTVLNVGLAAAYTGAKRLRDSGLAGKIKGKLQSENLSKYLKPGRSGGAEDKSKEKSVDDGLFKQKAPVVAKGLLKKEKTTDQTALQMLATYRNSKKGKISKEQNQELEKARSMIAKLKEVKG